MISRDQKGDPHLEPLSLSLHPAGIFSLDQRVAAVGGVVAAVAAAIAVTAVTAAVAVMLRSAAVVIAESSPLAAEFARGPSC